MLSGTHKPWSICSCVTSDASFSAATINTSGVMLLAWVRMEAMPTAGNMYTLLACKASNPQDKNEDCGLWKSGKAVGICVQQDGRWTDRFSLGLQSAGKWADNLTTCSMLCRQRGQQSKQHQMGRRDGRNR